MDRVEGINTSTIGGLPEQEGEASPNVASCKSVRKINKLSEGAAASIIQRCARNFLQRHGVLSNKKNTEYKILCTKNASSLKRRCGIGGASHVYFPSAYPEIIVKNPVQCPGEVRRAQMREVRGILDQQKSSCLIVPKVIQYSKYLVEDRLPVNTDPYHNMGLYLSSTELFDKAVCEMVRFSSKKQLRDLVTSTPDHPMGHIPGVNDGVRYDNLPLFVSEGVSEGVSEEVSEEVSGNNDKKEGCIGLIDLEHLSKRNDPESLHDLARIFPLHLGLIKEEADRLNMNYDASELGEAASRGECFLRKGYADHLKWLKNKDAELKLGSLTFEVKAERIKDLEEVVFNKLLSLSGGEEEAYPETNGNERSIPEFLKGDSDYKVRHLAREVALRITEKLKTESNTIERKMMANSSEVDEAEIIRSRSPIVSVLPYCYDISSVLFQSSSVDEKKVSGFGVQRALLNAVMAELARGGELYSYDPCYFSPYQICWIRF